MCRETDSGLVCWAHARAALSRAETRYAELALASVHEGEAAPPEEQLRAARDRLANARVVYARTARGAAMFRDMLATGRGLAAFPGSPGHPVYTPTRLDVEQALHAADLLRLARPYPSKID